MSQPVMEGGGEYDKHSTMQRDIGDFGLVALDWVGDEVPLPDEGPVVIADYGSSTGFNSIEVIATALLALRRRLPREQPIFVTHLDLEGNDWSTLFSTIKSTEGYGTGDPHVWTSAVGGSFYDQLLPPATVTMAWCATAVHWLSRTPSTLTDTFWPPRGRPEEVAAFKEQARVDWQNFLTARAAEIIPGGRMAIMALRDPIDPDNSYLPTLERMCEIFRQMVADGALRAEEWDRMVLPTWNRTMEEFLAPLEEEPLASAFELQGYADLARPMPTSVEFLRTGDVEALADAQAAAGRVAMQPVLMAQLDDDRSPDEKQAVMDDFFARQRADTLANPVAQGGSETAAIILHRR